MNQTTARNKFPSSNWLISLAALCASTSAWGDIIATSGDLESIDPPESVGLGAMQSADTVWAFAEREDHTLTMLIQLDITLPGHVDSNGDLTTGDLEPGLLVTDIDPDQWSLSSEGRHVLFQATREDGQTGLFRLAFGPDTDGDGLVDSLDNCIAVANADQRDTNGDGIGNICDADLENDCTVNFLDLGEMKVVFFGEDPDTDLDGEGSVNFLDLGIMKQEFFRNYAADNPSGIQNICDGS